MHTQPVINSRDQTTGQNTYLNVRPLNVCGLLSKQTCPDFVQVINDYDIIGSEPLDTQTRCPTEIMNLNTIVNGLDPHQMPNNPVSDMSSSLSNTCNQTRTPTEIVNGAENRCNQRQAAETNASSYNGNNIKLLSLNVCGLMSKQNCPDFIEYINNYDIIGLQETKMDDLDTVHIEGYKVFVKNRKSVLRRKSGGIALLVKQELCQFIKLIETESKLIQWFVLSKNLSNKDDILCGVFYIPPENSAYAVKEPYHEIQQELDSFTEPYTCICMFGDNNSRTKNIQDYIETDDFIFEAHNLQEINEEFMDEMRFFNGSNVSEKRNNSDKTVNNYGNKFIDFLHAKNMFILNGRTVGDLIGKVTSNDVSTIDYFISSANLLPTIDSLYVHEYCPMLSDVHCAVSLTLNIDPKYICCCQKITERKQKVWDKSKAEAFIQNINIDEVNKLDENLDQLQNRENVNQVDIDKLVEHVSAIFSSSAEESFGTFKTKVTENCNIHKKVNSKTPSWYGHDCKMHRKRFNKAKSAYKMSKTAENKNNLKTQSKNYKTAMKSFFRKFKKNNIKKMRKLKNSDPRKYWKILNGNKSNDIKASLDDLYTHFKNVNFSETIDEDDPPDNLYTHATENSAEILNSDISSEEIEKAAKHLKNNKACGIDHIVNEHIKATLPHMKHIYVKLFNIVLNSGFIPKSWTTGIINPIFKNKGDPKNAENYRPITLLSCFGKLFTAVLNTRLQTFLDANDIINDYQAGFRSGFSTVDNTFILHTLIQLQRNSKQKLYCAFIDLKQAFDTVWRSGLWQKMLSYNISGKFITVIKHMYSDIKSCVSVNNTCSNFFSSNIGVRQGENLSPLLFSLYLNDLHEYMENINALQGISLETDDDDTNIHIFLKLFIILYADDTVIVGKTAGDLQTALNAYEEYCDTWKLTVNTSKSKIVIFSKGRQGAPNLYFKNKPLEIVKEYKYLGMYFCRSCSFYQTKKHIASQGTRALYSLLKKLKPLFLPIDMQIDIFNKTVKPILLYGSETWGFGNIEIIERVQLKFLKHILNLKKSTPNCIVYGETGTFPIAVDIKTRIISFWSKMIEKRQNNLAVMVYTHLRRKYDTSATEIQNKDFMWIDNVKRILTTCGFVDIWRTQVFPNNKWLKEATKQKLKDLFINEWFNTIEQSSGCSTYTLIKNKFQFETYLINTPAKLLKPMIQFRTRNHRMPIETGRWNNIPREDRKCTLCNSDTGDEFHYTLICKELKQYRRKFIKEKYYKRPNVILFEELINTTNPQDYLKLCKFVKLIHDKLRG